MRQPHPSARRRERVRILAAVLVVVAVAWSVPGGVISADTKNDLYLDPWGFLARALHLWDPQVTWGVLQNQGYGYLFPMGPVLGALGEVFPVWVAQRLWWTAILVAGLLGTHALLRALRVGSPATRLVAAVGYALSPRVLTTLGGLSSEALPALLAPVVLLPVVLGSQARLGPRRAAALSGLAILACGGVNATATLLTAVPTGLWLVTRQRWWARSLTWWWVVAAGCASAWWLAPLVLLGRYSPPFLDWIESSADVVRTVDAVDVLRGTTHWLENLVTAAGPWWPAGYALETVPALIVATTLLAALGVAGAVLPGAPERRWLWGCAALGAFVILVGHPGPVSSPWAGDVRTLLDGPLAPLRNVHKADPLVRLPLAVGLAHALDVLARSVRGRVVVRSLVVAGVGLTTLGAVSPGLTGAIAPPGGYRETAPQWVEAGAWLSERADTGRALIVPAASFGEYDWGRPIDEPLRALSTVDQAVRDAVPLTPAGTIRFLDDVEHRLQEGTPLGGEVQVLRRAGIRWLVLRNDLDATVAGQPPVALARSAVRRSEGVALARGFGKTRLDASGERVFPVEVYDVGSASGLVLTQPTDSVVGVAGGAEDLARVLESGNTGLVVLDGDRPADLEVGRRVVTDGYRARDRWFGATRGRDASSTLSASDVPGTTDYRPWEDDTGLSSHVLWAGVRDVRASSSLASRYTIAGLRPADRPAAALDADPRTAWTTLGDERPTLEVDLAAPREVGSVHLEAFVPEGTRSGSLVGVVSRVRLTTDAGSVEADLDDRGRADVALPAGATARVRVEVLETDRGRPAQVLTGLATLRLEGVAPLEIVALPASADVARHGPADAVVLDGGLSGSSGCVRPRSDVVCLGAGALAPEGGADLARSLPDVGPGSFSARGTLAPARGGGVSGVTADGVSVEASSSRTDAAVGGPGVVLDGDATTAWSPAVGDRSPELTVRLARPVDVDALRLDARRDWMARNRPVVEVTLDGRTSTVRVNDQGFLAVSGVGVRSIGLRLLLDQRSVAAAGLELAELEVIGAELPRPAAETTWPCGSGPPLSIDGVAVPTSATGPRTALWGEGAVRWEACAPVVLGPGPHRVVLHAVDGWQPDTAVLERVGASTPGTAPTPVTAAHDGPTRITGTVPDGPQRVLALTVNSNSGWVATLAGRALDPVVVDGFRQGFVVPAGASGALDVRFAPDGPYRAALLMGALLALALPLALVLPAGRPRRLPAALRPLTSPVLVGLGGVLGAAAVGGAPGAAVAVAASAAVVATSGRGTASVGRTIGTAWAAGALAGAAGLLVAATTALRVEADWVEATSTLLLIAAVTGGAVACAARPTASRAARRGEDSPTRGGATPGGRSRAGEPRHP